MKISILFLLIHFQLVAQEKNCNDFKIGEFVYLNLDYSHWKVKRTQDTQIETDEISGMRIESKIEWKSDCEYELTYLKINDDKIQNLIGQKINVTIIKVSNNAALCKAKNSDLVLEMKKVSEY